VVASYVLIQQKMCIVGTLMAACVCGDLSVISFY